MRSSLSPCVGICKAEGDTCVGCLRTLKEIADWSKMDMEDRMEAMKAIQFRNATHECPLCEGPAYCAMEAGKSASTCWCMTLPKDYNPDIVGDRCMCRDCLEAQ